MNQSVVALKLSSYVLILRGGFVKKLTVTVSIKRLVYGYVSRKVRVKKWKN